MTATSFPLSRGLAYEGRLPLAWSELASLPSDAELAGLEYANLEILRAIFTLESQSSDPSEDSPEIDSQDVARLDFKLNLLLELVGQLFARHQMIPEPHSLTLMPEGLFWQAAAAPALNSLLRIEVYGSLKYPRPLVLHGQVIEVNPLIDGWAIGTAFHGLGELVQENLERFIFIHHRRTIAYNRHRSKEANKLSSK